MTAIKHFIHSTAKASLAVGLTLPVSATHAQIPDSNSCKIDISGQPTENREPYDGAALGLAESADVLSGASGVIVTVANLREELRQRRDLQKRTEQVGLLDLYRDKTLEIRQISERIERTKREISALSLQADVVEAGSINPTYNPPAARRLGFLRATLLTLQGDLQKALIKKAHLLDQVVSKTLIYGGSDQHVIGRIEEFAWNEVKARDNYLSKRGGRFAAMGGGVGLLVSGILIYLNSEHLAREFASLHIGELLNTQQLKAIEGAIDCAVLDGRTGDI